MNIPEIVDEIEKAVFEGTRSWPRRYVVCRACGKRMVWRWPPDLPTGTICWGCWEEKGYDKVQI